METPLNTSAQQQAGLFQKVHTACLETLGRRIRANTLNKIATCKGEEAPHDSIWFPYGSLGFGGHYGKSRLPAMLDQIPNDELGKKGLELRARIAAIVTSFILIGGGITHANKSPESKISTPSSKQQIQAKN